jgi:hypothetical protein
LAGLLILDLRTGGACSPEALVVAQRCRYARRRLHFSASPEKSNQKRGDFFRRSNLFSIRELP